MIAVWLCPRSGCLRYRNDHPLTTALIRFTTSIKLFPEHSQNPSLRNIRLPQPIDQRCEDRPLPGRRETGKVSDNPYVFTNAAVRLPRPRLLHDSIRRHSTGTMRFSLESGREGMIDSTTYSRLISIRGWPLYDDYNGWDRMNFMDSHEFYSDFNDYTVTVNVPKNHPVGHRPFSRRKACCSLPMQKRYRDPGCQTKRSGS